MEITCKVDPVMPIISLTYGSGIFIICLIWKPKYYVKESSADLTVAKIVKQSTAYLAITRTSPIR